MKRTRTTLGNLVKGDKFYFANDAKRIAHECGQWKKAHGLWFRYAHTATSTEKYRATIAVVKIETETPKA